MRRLLMVLALLWAAPVAAPVAAYETETMTFEEEPSLFVTVQPDAVFSGGAYVQGEIVVTIMITSLHPFESLNVEVPQIKGAEVETLLKPRMRKVKIYSGNGYVLEQVLAIYPQSSGKLVIPAVRAVGHVEPEKDKPLHFNEESPAITLDIAGIQPAFKGNWWMVSSAVTMTETWSKPVEELREGDVVRRTITLTARGVPHTRMQMPDHGRTRGIAFSDAGGSGRTERSADGVVGTLTRSWDLKIGIGSTLYIAPMGVHYWHPGEGASKKAGVRGYRIEPLPPDEAAISRTLMAEAEARHDGARMLALAAAGLVVVPLVLLALAWAWALVPTPADRQLRRSATGSSPEQIYRAVTAWAAETGVPMAELRHAGLTGLEALLAHLFANGRQSVDDGHVVRDLTQFARRRRLARITRFLGQVAADVLGRPAKLTSRI